MRSGSSIKKNIFLLVITALALPMTLHAQPQVQNPGAGQPPEINRMNQSEAIAQLRLAQVYEETRDLVNAVRIYEQVSKQRPEMREAFDGLVREYWYLKRFADLESLVKAKLATEPANTDLLLTYARTEARLNKKSDALEAFESAEKSLGPAQDCAALTGIAMSMLDVSYNDEALALLRKGEKLGDPGGYCASQIATIYLRMASYDNAAREYLTLLNSGESFLPVVQQRLSQFMTDSVARGMITGAVEHEIDYKTATLPALQLMAWLYGEQKRYDKALDVVTKIDDLGTKDHPQSRGYELLNFAERARAEGALDIAVKAYDLAIGRMRAAGSDRDQLNYFIAQAELGALRTNETYLRSKEKVVPEEIAALVTRYEVYAQRQPQSEFANDALVRAGQLAFQNIHDLDRASKNFEQVVNGSRGAFSERVREAAFGLVDIAIAKKDFATAATRLARIDASLDKRARSTDLEPRQRVLYDRALLEYFQLHFDSAQSQLTLIMDDPSSDYANDAIQLSDLLGENNTPQYLAALTTYATAALHEFAHEDAQAQPLYQSIAEAQASAPLADDAALRSADILVRLGKPSEAIKTLTLVDEKMLNSPLADRAYFRSAEIVEKELRDKVRAQQMYEEFLSKYPKSALGAEARDRARRLRGDLF